jgi:ribosomal protein S2
MATTNQTEPKDEGLYRQGRRTESPYRLEMAAEKLTEALDFVKQVKSEGKTIVFVEPRLRPENLVRDIAY